MNQKKRLSVKTVVLIGMFGALAAVLETFQIPVQVHLLFRKPISKSPPS